MMANQMFIIIFTLFSITCHGAIIVETDYELKVLSKQVKALIERRAEDLKSIEDNVRKIVFNGPEVEELRDQVRSLKEEIVELRSGVPIMPTTEKSTKNTELTIKWVKHTMKELKTEFLELVTTINATAMQEERNKNDLILIQNDMSALTEEFGEMRTNLMKKDATIQELKEEINSLRLDWRTMAEINGKLRNQMKATHLEWLSETKQGRHQRLIKHLYKSIKLLQKDNDQMKATLNGLTTGQDPIHRSMLELLEDVQNLESKVDGAVPELRKEVSKNDVQLIQRVAEDAAIKEDIKNVKTSLQAISYSVSKLQEDFQKDHEITERTFQHLNQLEQTASVQHARLHDHILKEESTLDNNSTKSTIHLVEELKSFESEYKSIVNKLPRDCMEVNDGQRGIYLISPGDAEPILTYCHNGWTTIQKRFDGSINFNRNWNEYGNGFGSATGEHWLGNRNIHHLTKDNCTELKINLKDIYGKYWEAQYSHFHIENYTKGYQLTVSGYSGNASDAMDYQNHMEFSTVDNDRDISNTHCANNYEGGWWYSHCQHANLNGRYNLGLTWFDGKRNEWIAVAESEMTVKRRSVC